MRLHNYLTDYIVTQQVSLNTFVFTRGHSVSNVIDSTHFNTLRGDFSSAEVTSLAAVRKPHCSRTGLQFSSVQFICCEQALSLPLCDVDLFRRSSACGKAAVINAADVVSTMMDAKMDSHWLQQQRQQWMPSRFCRS